MNIKHQFTKDIFTQKLNELGERKGMAWVRRHTNLRGRKYGSHMRKYNPQEFERQYHMWVLGKKVFEDENNKNCSTRMQQTTRKIQST